MYLTLFFSLLQKCHLTNSVALSDQTQPFIPSALPHQRNASFPLKALVEPSGKFTTCRGSPWPAQLGQHLGLAFRPLPGTQPALPGLLSQGLRAQANPPFTSPLALGLTLPGRTSLAHHIASWEMSPQPSGPSQPSLIPRAECQLLLLWATSSTLCLSWSPHLVCLRLVWE